MSRRHRPDSGSKHPGSPGHVPVASLASASSSPDDAAHQEALNQEPRKGRGGAGKRSSTTAAALSRRSTTTTTVTTEPEAEDAGANGHLQEQEQAEQEQEQRDTVPSTSRSRPQATSAMMGAASATPSSLPPAATAAAAPAHATAPARSYSRALLKKGEVPDDAVGKDSGEEVGLLYRLGPLVAPPSDAPASRKHPGDVLVSGGKAAKVGFAPGARGRAAAKAGTPRFCRHDTPHPNFAISHYHSAYYAGEDEDTRVEDYARAVRSRHDTTVPRQHHRKRPSTDGQGQEPQEPRANAEPSMSTPVSASARKRGLEAFDFEDAPSSHGRGVPRGLATEDVFADASSAPPKSVSASAHERERPAQRDAERQLEAEFADIRPAPTTAASAATGTTMAPLPNPRDRDGRAGAAQASGPRSSTPLLQAASHLTSGQRYVRQPFRSHSLLSDHSANRFVRNDAPARASAATDRHPIAAARGSGGAAARGFGGAAWGSRPAETTAHRSFSPCQSAGVAHTPRRFTGCGHNEQMAMGGAGASSTADLHQQIAGLKAEVKILQSRTYTIVLIRCMLVYAVLFCVCLWNMFQFDLSSFSIRWVGERDHKQVLLFGNLLSTFLSPLLSLPVCRCILGATAAAAGGRRKLPIGDSYKILRARARKGDFNMDIFHVLRYACHCFGGCLIFCMFVCEG